MRNFPKDMNLTAASGTARLSRAALLCTIIGLSGCVTGGSAAPVRTTGVAIPESLRQEALSYTTAQITTGYCPKLRIKLSQREQLANKVDATFVAAGVPLRFFSMEDVVSKEEAYGHVEAYMAKRGLKEGDRDAWCDAGRTEIAKRTQIGSFMASR